jgi:hypothetical protein
MPRYYIYNKLNNKKVYINIYQASIIAMIYNMYVRRKI